MNFIKRPSLRRAKRELLDYAAKKYLEGMASVSELAKKTGLDVPTIMEQRPAKQSKRNSGLM